jgi:hypothetical protein
MISEVKSLNKEVVACISKLMNLYETHKLRYPLFASLLISPIILLTPKKLLSRCMEQQSLLKVSFVSRNGTNMVKIN